MKTRYRINSNQAVKATPPPNLMRTRRCTVEHPFGTIKAWMGSTHFQMRGLKNVQTEMALHVLAYNIKRVISMIGVGALLSAIAA